LAQAQDIREVAQSILSTGRSNDRKRNDRNGKFIC